MESIVYVNISLNVEEHDYSEKCNFSHVNTVDSQQPSLGFREGTDRDWASKGSRQKADPPSLAPTLKLDA